MTKENLLKSVEELLETKRKIEEIETKKLNKLRILEDALKERVKMEMEAEGMQILESEKGTIQWIHRKGNLSLDKELVMKALGVTNLAQYQVEGKESTYLKIELKPITKA